MSTQETEFVTITKKEYDSIKEELDLFSALRRASVEVKKTILYLILWIVTAFPITEGTFYAMNSMSSFFVLVGMFVFAVWVALSGFFLYYSFKKVQCHFTNIKGSTNEDS